jgi:cell division protein FtsI/penicillin-binding protein 2
MDHNHSPRTRLYVLAGFIVAVLLVYLGVLYDIQVVHHEEYLAQSVHSIARAENVDASRGIIADRSGRTLVSNAYAYNLSHITYKPTNDDWCRLLDKLRVNGLLDYWLDKRYHDQAAEELKKVDWTKQPASVIRLYKTPIWILKVKRLIMSCGSFVKQTIFKKLHK